MKIIFTRIQNIHTTDNVHQSGLTRTGWSKNCNKFIIPEIQAHIIQGFLHQLLLQPQTDAQLEQQLEELLRGKDVQRSVISIIADLEQERE